MSNICGSIEIGNIVVVKDNSYSYPYMEDFLAHTCLGHLRKRFKRGRVVGSHDILVVLAKAYNPKSKTLENLYVCQSPDGQRVFIIGEDGLRKFDLDAPRFEPEYLYESKNSFKCAYGSQHAAQDLRKILTSLFDEIYSAHNDDLSPEEFEEAYEEDVEIFYNRPEMIRLRNFIEGVE